MRVYVRRVAGLEGVRIGRMDQALHLGRTNDVGRAWAQHPSEASIRQHPVSEAVYPPVRETTSQGQESPAHDKRPSGIRTCAHDSGESANLSL
jgi:hypothetical protein